MAECIEACRNEQNCLVFAYRTDHGMCWLKKEAGSVTTTITTQAKYISGMVAEYNVSLSIFLT